MAKEAAQLDDIKRRTYEGWQQSANLPYTLASASSSSRSLRANTFDYGSHWRNSKQGQAHQLDATDRKSAVANELRIEDITDAQDTGYDADVDVQFPDEYDEPNTDEEKLPEADVDPSDQHEAGLVERFERLLREDRGRRNHLLKPLGDGKQRVTSRKRTHSQNSNISSDSDTSGTVNAYGTVRDTKHYRRRQKTHHPREDSSNQPDGEEKGSSGFVVQDAMDVD